MLFAIVLQFCPGRLTEEQAFKAAIATWPAGMRPVVHWSESQAGRKPHAHSNYVRCLPNLYGRAADVDVMVEAKAKEQAVLCFRGDQPFLPDLPTEEEEVVDKLVSSSSLPAGLKSSLLVH